MVNLAYSLCIVYIDSHSSEDSGLLPTFVSGYKRLPLREPAYKDIASYSFRRQRHARITSRVGLKGMKTGGLAPSGPKRDINS